MNQASWAAYVSVMTQTTHIRVRDLSPGDPEDAAAAAETRRAALPFMLVTPELLAWEAEHSPAEAHYRLLVAELDGRVVGTARTGLFFDNPEPGKAYCNLYVHPDATGRGAGSALLAAAEEHLAGLGARSVYAWALEDGHSVAWAGRRGYEPRRRARFLRLDLAALPPETAPPAGIALRTAADFADDPRPLYELDAAVSLDEPGEVEREPMPYKAWLAAHWERPGLDRALSVVAVADGAPVAFSLARTDGRGRYMSAMTGTAREWRGQGLARLAKSRSLHLARAAGCREAFTGNDAGNGPMLAVNRWFGYGPAADEWHCVRELG